MCPKEFWVVFLVKWEVKLQRCVSDNDILFTPVLGSNTRSSLRCCECCLLQHQGQLCCIEWTILAFTRFKKHSYRLLIVVVYTRTTAGTNNRHFKGLALDKGINLHTFGLCFPNTLWTKRLLFLSLNAILSTDLFAIFFSPWNRASWYCSFGQVNEVQGLLSFKTVAIQKDVSRMAGLAWN